jgi:hypothetical protein
LAPRCLLTRSVSFTSGSYVHLVSTFFEHAPRVEMGRDCLDCFSDHMQPGKTAYYRRKWLVLSYKWLRPLQTETADKPMFTERDPHDLLPVVVGIKRLLQSPRRR